MHAKNALLICLTTLSSVFGAAALPPKSPERALAVTETYTPLVTNDGRLPFKPGVEDELQSTAVKMLWKLGTHGEWTMTKQIWALQDIIYYKTPLPVYNRLVTALNDDADRKKIVGALVALANGVLNDDKVVSQKCRDSIKSWSADPLNFARYVSGVIGKDIVSEPKHVAAPAPAKK